MPARYLAAHDHGRLAARNRRAAVAGPARPGKDAGTPGAQPQPPVTGITRFLRCGGRQADSFWNGKDFWGANGVCSPSGPQGQQIPGTAGVWSSTTTSLTDATHCGLVYYHCCRTNLVNASASSSNAG
jgi:hypothetical protein